MKNKIRFAISLYLRSVLILVSNSPVRGIEKEVSSVILPSLRKRFA